MKSPVALGCIKAGAPRLINFGFGASLSKSSPFDRYPPSRILHYVFNYSLPIAKLYKIQLLMQHTRIEAVIGPFETVMKARGEEQTGESEYQPESASGEGVWENIRE